jgi:UDP-N-acetylmuramyl pentapeptide phosphotransferase/UDP-N-acetylglucosamine-1-phosphate transferase
MLEFWTSFLAAILSIELIRQYAIRRNLVDNPNARSLHTMPVPRIGGVGLVFAVLCGFAVHCIFNSLWPNGRIFVLCGAPVFVVGLIDDLKPLRSSLRFLLQIAVASLVLYFAQPFDLNVFGVPLALPRLLVALLEGFWIVALINIYNFMDGMDGLAGSQAFTFAGALLGLSLTLPTVETIWVSSFAMCVMGASLGFLLQNMPPARIFMGDGASTFLGYCFAVLPLILAQAPAHEHGAPAGVAAPRESIPFALAVSALAPFLCDATFTLLRRALRGEKVWQAHRTHLYQRAVATGLTHRDVLLVYNAWMGWAVLCALFGRTLTQPGKPLSQLPGTHYWPIASLLLACAPLLLVFRWVTAREQQKPPAVKVD